VHIPSVSMSTSRVFRPLSNAVRPTLSNKAAINVSPVRHASSGPSGPARRFLSGTLLLAGGATFLAYHYDSRSMLHDKIAMPFIRLMDPEWSHKAALTLLGNWWIRPTAKGDDGPELQAEVCFLHQDIEQADVMCSFLVCPSRIRLVWPLDLIKTVMRSTGYSTWVLVMWKWAVSRQSPK
jgi:hypothetical protein